MFHHKCGKKTEGIVKSSPLVGRTGAIPLFAASMLLTTICASGSVATASPNDSSPKERGNVLILTDNSLVEGQFTDAQPIAPESFAVEGERIYVDNPIASAISVYEKGRLMSSIPLVKDLGIKDISVS